VQLPSQKTDRTASPAAGSTCTACGKSSTAGRIGIRKQQQQQQQQQQQKQKQKQKQQQKQYPRRQYDKPWKQQQQQQPQQPQEEGPSLGLEKFSPANTMQEDSQEVCWPGCM
jgi:hypothetical protein